jgi:acyl-coenzyme A synthetase/AMP-(fatty) acid ligase/acyl carrier protein
MVTHRNLVRLVRNTNYIHFTGDEVVAQTANTSFDASAFEIWGALLNGCCLVGIDPAIELDPNDFALEVARRKINVMFITTALFNEIARARPDAFLPVGHVLFGGEVANPGAVAAVLERGYSGKLTNVYGPTEATVFASTYTATEVRKDAASLPIGTPVGTTQLYVLDREMNPQPVGVADELMIAGEGVARGYWRRPDLTADKFRPNPFSSEPGARLYRSGDRVRRLPDGLLDYIDRIDNQIKIRGFRVELGEIEAALRGIEGVRECAVVLKTGSGGGSDDDKRLIAYVASDTADRDLRSLLKGRLPEFMIPGVFITLPELPLTPNGKVDRRALPKVEASRLDQAVPWLAPGTVVEELLTEIWAEVLGVPRVGMNDNFFDLGGHSLLALRVVSRIKDSFQMDLPVRTLLEFPAIREFTSVLLTTSPRSAEQLEKIARITLKVRRMTPEEKKAALGRLAEKKAGA